MRTGFVATTLASLLLGLGTAPTARAQDPDEADDVEPGQQAEPPGPEDIPAPTVNPDDRQRTGIRGTRPTSDRAEDPNEKAQREWEEQTFPDVGDTTADDTDEARAERPRRQTVQGKEDLPPELRSPQPDDAPGGVGGIAAAGAKPEDVRPDLPWLKDLKTGDIPVRWDQRVITYLEYYHDDPTGQALIRGWFKAQGRFRTLILDALRRHQLPEDLLYLCMIESSYDPWEYSRVGASGLWQFMPGAGKVYGLNIDFWVDERNDPEKSTEAALLHWRDLYDRFGNWHLSIAAYNAGYGAVLKAIAKFNSNDFWGLLQFESGLPWGSSIYVPKALAVMIVGHNRAAFGIEGLAEEPNWDFDRVLVPTSVSLAVLGKAAGVSANDIAWLNPELRRGRTPPGVKDYAVRIPRGKKEQFAKTFAQLRGDWDGFDAYVVRYGERFEDIARVHGLSVAKLRELNGVVETAEVRGGMLIVVPKVDDATRAKNQLAADQDLYHSDVAPGGPDDPMIVAVPDPSFTVAGKRRVFYRVVGGDTLEEVARALQVKPAALLAWNKLDAGAKIQPRMVIVAWVDPTFDADVAHVALLDDSRLMLVTAGTPEHMAVVEGRKGRKRVLVKAKKGDTLESVGRPHSLSKYDMARINHLAVSTKLAGGEELIVYVVVDRAKAKKAGVFDKKKRKLDPPKRAKKPTAKK